MPYWNRSQLLKEGLDKYSEFYGDWLEVIVVDDGSYDPPDIDEHPFPVHVITLPRKERALNPCVPINEGVAVAGAEIICLTNPEVHHSKPILLDMISELSLQGEKGYVLAACKYEDRFICRSDLKGKHCDRLPPGSGLHFCAVLYRDFFYSIGGFDEAYRNGGGYEDNDFAWAVHKGGGRAVVRDDLVVTHHRTNSKFTGRGTNKGLFYKKWEPYWNRL